MNDIFVEVEKQVASLKRQASKARRYAELREQMRGLLRIVLASKAEHLDIEAARLENLLRDMEAAEEREARSVHELETEQERLSSRTYDLDAELRQTQNMLDQTALDLDRAENRITFNREQAAQFESRATAFWLSKSSKRSARRSELIDATWPRSRKPWSRFGNKRCDRNSFARIGRACFRQRSRCEISSNHAWKSCGN